MGPWIPGRRPSWLPEGTPDLCGWTAQVCMYLHLVKGQCLSLFHRLQVVRELIGGGGRLACVLWLVGAHAESMKLVIQLAPAVRRVCGHLCLEGLFIRCPAEALVVSSKPCDCADEGQQVCSKFRVVLHQGQPESAECHYPFRELLYGSKCPLVPSRYKDSMMHSGRKAESST